MGTFKKRGVCSRGIMRLVLLALVITGQAAWAQSLQDLRRSYFVPLPEEQLLASMRDIAGNSRPGSPLISVTSLTVGTGGTVIYWDQWEDGGYDADPYNPGNVYSASNPQGTQIWGDSNLANGCPPLRNGAVNPCAVPTDDFFQGGDVVFTRNEVPIHGRSAPFRRQARDDCRLWPNNALLSDHCFDGRDKISATYPLVVSRSGWATGSDSLLAGAVEVPSTFQPAAPADDGFLRAGGRLEVPVGTDTSNDQSMFGYSAIYVMAGEGGASGTAAGTAFTLGEGEGQLIANVQEGDIVSLTSGSAQVHLITGQIRSGYETRWYLLTPTAAWANEYITPVGSTTANDGCTGLFVYNPSTGPAPLTVTYTDGSGTSSSINVPPGASARSPRIPSGFGARVSAASPFYALSVTDCNGGQIYDWGYALVPVPQLTTSVEVGWAPGCTTSNCGRSGQATTRDSRSPLWITAESGPTTVYVDFDGQGAGCTQDGQPTGRARAIPLNALQAVKVTDDPPADPNIGSQGDYSMTGARVFTCDGTEISVAWGQDPALSGNSDQEGLDLGSGVPPLGSKLRCDVRADKATVPVGGDTNVTYTFRVFNDGEIALGPEIKLLNTFRSPPPPDLPTSCTEPAYVQGDTDGQGGPRDNILQPGEVWEYTCTVDVPTVDEQLGTSPPTYFPVLSVAAAFSTTPLLASSACTWKVVPEAVDFDFGDTPGSYGGPGHRIPTSPALYLGGPPDGDPGLQNAAPNQTNALGDDNNGATPDDEDGVAIQVLPGGAIEATVTVVNTTGSDATLCGWLDGGVDGIVNGVFTASEGRCITSAAATETLTWSPPSAPLGAYARFRVTTDPLGVSDGGVTEANDGEVEDYRVEFLDFGDAPDGYGTTLASGGARHVVTPDLFLGSEVDSEPDGLPTAIADGDDNDNLDDEDGAVLIYVADPNDVNYVYIAPRVLVTNNTGAEATLCGWIDLDPSGLPDGQFVADEGVCVTVPASGSSPDCVETTTTTGLFGCKFPELSGLGTWRQDRRGSVSYARFRVTAAANGMTIADPLGVFPDGEVEDYIAPTPPPEGRAELACIGSVSPNPVEKGEDVILSVDATEPDSIGNAKAPTAAVYVPEGLTFKGVLSLSSSGTLLNATCTPDPIEPGPVRVICELVDTLGTNEDWELKVIAGTDQATTSPIRFDADVTWQNPPDDIVQCGGDFDINIVGPDDRGDAPASYGEAVHTITSDLYLGDAVDGEISSLASPDALRDDDDNTDDEDGVVFTLSLSQIIARVTVTSTRTTPFYVNSWIDLDGLNGFDPSEGRQAESSSCAPFAGVADKYECTLIWDNLSLARGQSYYARFRLSSQQNVSSVGDAPDGEDEDYRIDIGTTLAGIERFAVETDPETSTPAVTWDTRFEVGTLAFHIERLDVTLDDYVMVNVDPIPSLSLFGDHQGGTYRYLDTEVWSGETHTYRLIEIERVGDATGERIHGPYTVTVDDPGWRATDLPPAAAAAALDDAPAAEDAQRPLKRQLRDGWLTQQAWPAERRLHKGERRGDARADTNQRRSERRAAHHAGRAARGREAAQGTNGPTPRKGRKAEEAR